MAKIPCPKWLFPKINEPGSSKKQNILPVCGFWSFQQNMPAWFVLFDNCPLPTKRARSIVSGSGFATPNSKSRSAMENVCRRTAQHKFQSVGNRACMSTFPDLRPFCCQNCPMFFWLSLFICVECENQDSTQHLAGNLFNTRRPNFNLHQDYHPLRQKTCFEESCQLIWPEINKFGKAGYLDSFFWDLPVWQKSVSNFQKSKK